jgi:transposase
MDDALVEFQKAAARENRGRQGLRRRYSPALQARAVEYWRVRQRRGDAVLDRIWQWATVQVGLPRSEFGKAVRYMLKRWEGLTRFVEDPRVPLDNNAAERALRGPVVGRKNHYGSRSLRGMQVAALFYTLCEAAKLAGIDPHAYLLRALYSAMAESGAVTYPEELLVSTPTT